MLVIDAHNEYKFTLCHFVSRCFAAEVDLAGMQVDVALRKFQTYFRMPVRMLS